MKPSTIRLCGIAVALGAIIWSVGWLQAGVRPEGPDGMPINDQVEIWAGGIFLLGVLALLFAMRATFATGTGRAGRWVLNGVTGFVVLAVAWNIPYSFDANRESTLILSVLDVFWPLSMVGLLVVGVLVLRARRWPTPARYLPLAASLLIPIDIALALTGVGEWPQIVVRSVYLSVSYTLLGVAVVSQVAPMVERATSTPGAYLEAEHA